ncbi:MAG: hypothetical protein AAGF58_15840 [Pseudomonadota bacterium]
MIKSTRYHRVKRGIGPTKCLFWPVFSAVLRVGENGGLAVLEPRGDARQI